MSKLLQLIIDSSSGVANVFKCLVGKKKVPTEIPDVFSMLLEALKTRDPVDIFICLFTPPKHEEEKPTVAPTWSTEMGKWTEKVPPVNNAEGTGAEGTGAEGTGAEGTDAGGTGAEGTDAKGPGAEGTDAEGTDTEETDPKDAGETEGQR